MNNLTGVPMHAWMYLRDGEHGGEVDDEVVLEVADGDLVGVPDELAAAEDAGAGRDEGDAELEDHVGEVEEVGEGADGGDEDADAHVHGDAGGEAVGVEEVEVERVDEEADEAGDEEEAVPPEHDVVARVEDAAGRPRAPRRGAARQRRGGRAGARVEEGQRRPAERREDAAGDEAGHGRGLGRGGQSGPGKVALARAGDGARREEDEGGMRARVRCVRVLCARPRVAGSHVCRAPGAPSTHRGMIAAFRRTDGGVCRRACQCLFFLKQLSQCMVGTNK